MAVIIIHPESARLAAYGAFWSMVLLAIIIHKTSVDVDMSKTPLMDVFGFNNICIYWDYTPSREITAMYYPLVEYPLIAYVILSFLQYRASALEGRVPMWFYRLCQVIMAVQFVLYAWFRMIFVIDGFKNLAGHTAGFMGLQVGLIINSIHNAIYNFLIKTRLDTIRGLKWTRLGLVHTRILTGIYVAILAIVTVIKLTINLSIFNGSPVVDTKSPSGASFAQTIDILWMLLAAVTPVPIAVVQLWSEPALRFDISLGDNEVCDLPQSEKEASQGLEEVSSRVVSIVCQGSDR